MRPRPNTTKDYIQYSYSAKKTHQKRYAGHPFFGPFLDSPGEAGRELPRGTSTQQVANEKTKRMQKGMTRNIPNSSKRAQLHKSWYHINPDV